MGFLLKALDIEKGEELKVILLLVQSFFLGIYMSTCRYSGILGRGIGHPEYIMGRELPRKNRVLEPEQRSALEQSKSCAV